MNSTMCVGAKALVLSILLLQPWAMAQQGSQGGGGTGSTTRTDTSKGTAGRSQPQPPKGLEPNTQLVFVMGEVVTEDGAPPPFGTMIERDCLGRATTQANVDSSGHFQFQLGGDSRTDNSLLPEASDAPSAGFDPYSDKGIQQSALPSSFGALPATNWMGCELRARLPGYRSSTVRLDGSPMSGQVDVGTIVLHPTSKIQGTMISVTDLKAPKGAKKSLERAQEALQRNNIAEAKKNLDAAVKAYPDYANAWLLLGEVYEEEKLVPDATAAYKKAVTIDEKFVSPYVKLARIAGGEKNWQEVVDLTDRALGLDPLDFPDSYFLSALGNYNLNNMDAAEKSARKAIRLDSLHRIPQVHLVLANVLHKKGDIAGALAEMREYLKYAPNADDAEAVRARLQEEEKLAETLPSNPPATAH